MDSHAFRVLEFEPVRELIAKKTTNIYGRQAIENRSPGRDLEEIKSLRKETEEALAVLDSREPFTVGELEEIRNYLVMAQKNIPLQPKDILAVKDVALRSRLLLQYLSVREALMPNLYEKSKIIQIFTDLEKSISKSIGSDGLILDSASKNLESIRTSLNIMRNRIQSQLDHFLRNSEFSKMLQEPIITRREHRFVLPVKQEYRSQFPGLVLDSSASGATLFMEPVIVLKMTNEVKVLDSEEKREEEQIRLNLSAKIAACSDDLMRNLDFIGHYDALQAAARFMIDFNCIIPEIQDKPIIDLKAARHPLIGEKAIPIDIRVGGDFSGLVITGPNTGGKTVSLKTAGLFTMLALSGFPIPAKEGSKIGLFTGIYADIGDEQSISQSLSTFSSHMTNINRILPRAGRRTLVLLDEIGAGTDPSEGVALASGILRYLVDRGSLVIVTTHYNELKAFASRSSEFKNAAVEFNEETLEPMYRIEIGLPGRSCALKIAARLGIPEQVLEESRKLMGQGHLTIDSLLSDIDQEKTIAKKERIEAENERESLNALRFEYETKIAEIQKEKEEIISKAKQEASDLTGEVFRELEESRREWRKSLKEYKQSKKSRDEVRLDEQKVRNRLNDTVQKLKNIEQSESGEGDFENSFNEGDLVKLLNIGRRGRVIRQIDGSKVLVQVENIKFEVPARELEKVDVQFAEEPKFVQEMRVNKAMTISDHIDIRGTRADEGIEILAKYIDDAFLANLETFRIIHGKGTGALREAVREYLKNTPRIKSFRDGDTHEGGWGATVVNL